MTQLAILGGAPAFAHAMHVGKPNVGNVHRFLERSQDIVASGRLTNYGPAVAEFERRIAEFTGVEHCVATCNATSALTLVGTALALTGSVVMPGFTFIATAHAFHGQGLRVIFADVDADSQHLCIEALACRVQPDTTAVIAVNLWGKPGPIAELEQFCRKRNLKLIFDSAQAFGSTYRGRPLGGFGDAEVFSFHATKAVNSFEGGAVTTNDAGLAAKLRLLINFGFSGEDCIDSWGTNAKMPEICAAMGITSIEAMHSIFAHNLDIHRRYDALLSSIRGLRLMPYNAQERSARNYVVVLVDDGFALNRDELVQVLRAENVLARRYFNPPCHRAEPYRNLPENIALHLPGVDNVCSTIMCLPTGTAVSLEDVNRICAIIAQAGAAADAIRQALVTEAGASQ